MFNYRLPVHALQNVTSYRDIERMFFVSKVTSDLYFRHFLKDLRSIIADFEKHFTFEYSDVISGDTFRLTNHPRFKMKSIYETLDIFKTRLDVLRTSFQTVQNYKNKRMNYITRYQEVTEHVQIPDLHFLCFSGTGNLASTNVPVVDTSFFSLVDNVSTYPQSGTYYLNADGPMSYIESSDVWWDRHKYYIRSYGVETELVPEVENVDGYEIFIQSDPTGDRQVHLRPAINGTPYPAYLEIGTSFDFSNVHLIYSSALSSWIIVGTST